MFQVSGTDHHQMLAIDIELARIAISIPDVPVAEYIVKSWVMRSAATLRGEGDTLTLTAFGGIRATIPKPPASGINARTIAMLTAWLPVAEAELKTRRAALTARQNLGKAKT